MKASGGADAASDDDGHQRAGYAGSGRSGVAVSGGYGTMINGVIYNVTVINMAKQNEVSSTPGWSGAQGPAQR